jgi:hypothetical protein
LPKGRCDRPTISSPIWSWNIGKVGRSIPVRRGNMMTSAYPGAARHRHLEGWLRNLEVARRPRRSRQKFDWRAFT